MGAGLGAATRQEEEEDLPLATREFHAAARNGDVEAMKLMLRECGARRAALVDAFDDAFEEPPLIAACRAGQTAAVELLLNSAADPNQAGANRWTALMLACQLGHVRIVKLLLACPNIEVNKSTGKKEEGTPLLWCRTEELRALLLSRGAALSDAVLIKQFEEEWARREAFEREAERVGRENLDLQRAARVPPEGTGRQLVEAAKSGDLKRLRPLLEEWSGHSILNFADPADNGGYTALHWACARGNYGVTELLLNTPGLDVNKANTTGNTPLMLAACYCHVKVVILLTGCKALVDGSINRQSLDGKTPLSISSNKEIQGVLVSRGACQ